MLFRCLPLSTEEELVGMRVFPTLGVPPKYYHPPRAAWNSGGPFPGVADLVLSS